LARFATIEEKSIKSYLKSKYSWYLRTRWPDVVQRDALQLLGIRGWRRRAAKRDEWRRLMREAKARKGAVAP
jgi:hypothetical protein